MFNKENTLSLSVFVFAISIVVISSISIIYPAFIIILVSSETDINPFEQGVWAIPFVVINIIIMDIAILYHYKKLPSFVVKAISFILDFEISKRWTVVILCVIIGSYVAISYPELFLIEGEEWVDYTVRVEPVLENFPESFFLGGNMVSKLIVKNFLLVSSIQIFGNVRILPFVASVCLLLLTYLFTTKISGKRFSGIISLIVLIQSRTFLDFDSTATYSNFWTLFYLLSLYLIYKKWYLSMPVYILSIFCKSMTIIFLPVTFFAILKTKISKRKKIMACIPYISILILILIGAMTFLIPKEPSFNALEFLVGFTVWVFQLRDDVVLFTLLLPLTVGLFLASRRGVIMADTLLILITGMLLTGPLIMGFTNFNVHPYRFVPLIVFFSIGIGSLFTNKSRNRT